MTGKAGAEVIYVLISAPSAVRRAALESIVRNAKITKLVGGLYGLDALARNLQQFQPDVVMVDLEHQDSRLTATPSSVDDDSPSVPTVVLFDHPERGWLTEAIRAGVKVVLGRDASAGDILLAIQSAFSGLIMLEPETARELLQNSRPEYSVSTGHVIEDLTAREIEVLKMLADGLPNKAISVRLAISEHTVKFHISSILAKMGVSSRTEAVTQGFRRGLILI